MPANQTQGANIGNGMEKVDTATELPYLKEVESSVEVQYMCVSVVISVGNCGTWGVCAAD